ncbi:hypothetical protein LTR99_006628 [Exophiala xenobiotica]|uniref:Uncharacterized protein n=1 Tax=Vermiconidia calcicola TaxID=1690605 RepID=A0AAV9QCH9_9PEZI|nr:hypothetical protein LTR92_007973 [Exophiala xenobiotica]KAK5532583.1 hypothetical protein LTR23_009552 [Chaetothyriales sp. CCFEE 6169]KAK5537798.1 hypothetical protein LTR25_005050 [Vermiconidia calcicola]KAK5205225.1 hypothetical protein LTR41_009074 [Exophiala xenobiotica]KAK5218996.1 hypothetical protein LTR72_008178 [Exophiala xenobiotica]
MYPATGNGTLVVDVVVNNVPIDVDVSVLIDVDVSVLIDVDVEVSVSVTTVQPMLLISCSPSHL